MRKVNLYIYYRFGFNYALLTDHKSGSVNNEEFLADLNDYLTFVERLKLGVTQSSFKLKKLDLDLKKLRKHAEQEPKELVENELFSSIMKKLNEVDNVLDAELHTKSVYMMEEKRYSSNILTDDISKIFADEVFDALPPVAQYDFKECGMCLAFDRYTASAYHALRATEDVLKLFTVRLLKISVKKTDTWAIFVNKIATEVKSKKIKPAPPEELMINLDNLRKYYRNKTQHPELMYTSDQAQDLIGLCAKTVSEMIQDLRNRNLIIDELITPFVV